MKFIPVAVIAFVLMFLPVDTVLAQGGLVTCSGADCGSCQLVAMINLIIVWLIGILFMLFAVMMVVAGFGLVTSGGNQSALEAAKSKFTNAIIGIIIVIAAWLIVDTVMKGLVGGGSSGAAMGELVGWGPWSRVQCTAQAVPQAYVPPATPPGGTPPPGGTTPPGGSVAAGCDSCTPIPSNIPTNGNACAAGYTCQIRPDMAGRLTAAQLAANGLRVSEAWPPTGYSTSDPTGVHASACHGNATCVDVSFNQNNPSGSQVEAFIQSSRQNNLTAVYEVPNATRQAELRAAGVSNVIVVSGINREHYSVYMCDVDGRANACR